MVDIPLLTNIVKDILRFEEHNYDHYVWITAIYIYQDVSHTIDPMLEWVENSDIAYWDCGWHYILDSGEFQEKIREAGMVLDFIVYFRFLRAEDAMLFKLTWAEHLVE